METQGEVSHTLVYCGDGSVDTDVDDQTQRHVDAAVELLRTDLGIKARRFTADESQAERQKLLDRFERGDIEALVAIRCLDEGVDVPATETAYVLASSSNPRQFIQRRGRILRQHPGKDIAVVHDFIVAPPQQDAGMPREESAFRAERSLIRKELERVEMFAESARNHPDADVDGIPTNERSLQELKRQYGLLDL
jgi:superfamily II DNA or RNA helicase